MTVKVLNEYTLPHSNRKAVIIVDNEANCFGVDFYENDSIIGREMYQIKVNTGQKMRLKIGSLV